MSIRYELDDEEKMADDSFEYEQLILGSCAGVALSRRGPNDPHVMFTLLVEDDMFWHVSNNGFSTGWLNEVLEVHRAAKKWLKANCSRDSEGFKFKN